MTPTRHLAALAAAAALLFMLGGLLVAEAGAADNDCAVAQTAFGDCTGYVAGVENKLSPRCCRALADIRDMAPTFVRQRALCACIHKEMVAAGKVVTRRAAALPGRCGVRISFLPTTHNFDCSRIPRAD
ncbi:hypothetical protein ZWY2020_050650 [Hordeum vulgare]|nr:hypothetical protein ZWY2020_050650 [Hordeum vulgare]